MFFFFWINPVSDTLICASVSDLKVLSVHFAFKLAVRLSAAVLPIDLPWAARGASAFFLSMLHTLCCCSHLLVNLSVYLIPPHVPCIFSVCTILQHCVCFHGLFLMDSHFVCWLFSFHTPSIILTPSKFGCYLHCGNMNRFQWNSMVLLLFCFPYDKS